MVLLQSRNGPSVLPPFAGTGEEVANEDILKGYKVHTDTSVEATKEKLKNVALELTRTIEIDDFVDRSEIIRAT